MDLGQALTSGKVCDVMEGPGGVVGGPAEHAAEVHGIGDVVGAVRGAPPGAFVDEVQVQFRPDQFQPARRVLAAQEKDPAARQALPQPGQLQRRQLSRRFGQGRLDPGRLLPESK